MRKFYSLLSILTLFALFGFGCARQPISPKNENNYPNYGEWIKNTTGLKLITSASPLYGPSVTFTDPSTGIKFESVLPPSFSDNNGKYFGPKQDESIETQIGVGGTIENDREIFGNLQALENFEDGTLNGWKITTAYDTQKQRWVARALLQDPIYGDRAYHVIECLSVTDSDKNFWDSCRTILEKARIITQKASAD
ncbi:hypothetical protein KKF59_01025 [Patescibacteria group bacterium]|nr:hypothetical protein [Patescibacteria group bacterium]MBU1034452.1 hypothetical protein [Patescibacteria group bacterium]MBU1630010.1 hypothetical protein [Patescibacteria group bacterium]MBU1907697.1 hypothetical protein [Patescibacteria group bacterium]